MALSTLYLSRNQRAKSVVHRDTSKIATRRPRVFHIILYSRIRLFENGAFVTRSSVSTASRIRCFCHEYGQMGVHMVSTLFNGHSCSLIALKWNKFQCEFSISPWGPEGIVVNSGAGTNVCPLQISRQYGFPCRFFFEWKFTCLDRIQQLCHWKCLSTNNNNQMSTVPVGRKTGPRTLCHLLVSSFVGHSRVKWLHSWRRTGQTERSLND